MRPPRANHNILGQLYHRQKPSLKKLILEDLHDRGIKDGKIGYWLRNIPDADLVKMPGNMMDVFVKHIPGSAKILKPELLELRQELVTE